MTAPSARFGAAALGAGLLAAALLPGYRAGLGVLVVAVAIAAAVCVGLRPSTVGGSERRWTAVWAALALLLAATAVLRDASWVVGLALVGSVLLGSLAVAGGRTWPGVLGGLVAAPVRSIPGVAAVARSAATALPEGSGGSVGPVLRGGGLAVGLLTVFGVLFVSADSAFADIANEALGGVTDVGPLPLRIAAFVTAIAFAGGLVVARRATADAGDLPAPKRRLGAIEWTIALVALDALFAAFVAVQAAVLFGKDDHVLRTAGLTYAEYAREGFAQLLVAAALTLAVAGAALRWSDAVTPARRRLLRILVGVLCALTLVVLASALHRLGLYQDAFGATRVRFAAHAALLYVGALLVLLLAALATRRERHLPRGATLATALALLGFVLADPDRRIGERNVERYAQTGRLDTDYVQSLSADATPALIRLPRRLHRMAFAEVATRTDDDGLPGFNLARARARNLLD